MQTFCFLGNKVCIYLLDQLRVCIQELNLGDNLIKAEESENVTLAN